MANLLVIAVCLVAGFILQRKKVLPDNSAHVLNLYVIYIAVPALVLSVLPNLTIDTDVFIPLFSAWFSMLLAALITFALSKFLSWSRPVTGAMLILVPLGNTSFVGFPLVEACLGLEALPYAAIYDQFGSFIAVSTYCLFILALYGDDQTLRPSVLSVSKKLVTFPPFIALILGLLTLPFEYPELLFTTLTKIGASLVPVVMVAVGLQWQPRLDSHYLRPLAIGLLLKLLLIPLALFVSLSIFTDMPIAAKASILEAAMPTMITAGALASSHNLAPKLCSALVGYGLLLSLFTVPIWAWLISIV